LQRLFNAVHQIVECHPIEGHRGKEAQDEAFRTRKSRLQWPDSKHNLSPSMAVDVCPDAVPGDAKVDIDWNYLPHFYFLAGAVKATAAQLGIKVRWGGDWDSDGNLKENTFNDLVHFELA
jgi:hypothetical protein